MNHTIWQSIAETSFWVYMIYAAIVYFGYHHSKQRVIPTVILWTNMIAVTTATVIGMLLFVKFNLSSTAYWAGMFLLGATCGWLHYHRLQVQHLPDTGKLLIPGSWVTMTAISGVMTARYYYGADLSLDPAILKTGEYSSLLMAIYGMMTGLYIGRIMYVRRMIKQAA